MNNLEAQLDYILGATNVRPLESTETTRSTPWGQADYQYKIRRGVALVNTPGHGGFLISKGVAKTYLSEAAQNAGESYGGYLAYEEDVDAAIILFEHQELIELLGYFSQDCSREKLVSNTLLVYRREYLASRGYSVPVLEERLKAGLPITW